MAGKNPIMGAIGGGLAGYGVGGIGNSLAAATPAGTFSATPLVSGGGSAVIPEIANTPTLANHLAQASGNLSSVGPTITPIEYASRNAQMGAGLSNVFDSPTSAFNFAKGNIGNIASVAAPMVMSSLGTQNTLPVGTGSTGPQKFANYAMKPMEYDPRTGKYSNPTYSPVNYSTSYNPNMAYAAGGGSMQDIQANALGGTVPNENQFYPGANIARGGASSAPQAPSATDVMGGYDQKLDQYTGEPVRMAEGGMLGGAIDFRTLFQQNPELMKMLTEQQRPAAPQYDYNQEDQQYTQRMAGGGLASLDTYAAGGRLLQGPGDGMSDSIPAVIGGAKPQRAALAQGEFVVPADVVSHLGNGSTDAGSKRLYAMMDKVRHARTGNKKQGRQINPDKFMPA
jgi:hypothetical protein